MLEAGRELESAALRMQGVGAVTRCHLRKTTSARRVVNSRGLDRYLEHTGYLASLSLRASRGDAACPEGHAEAYIPYLNMLDCKALAKQALHSANRLDGGGDLPPAAVRSGKYAVVLSAEVTRNIMVTAWSAFIGERMRSGSSVFRLDEREIASPLLSIVDDPTPPNWSVNYSLDSEGTIRALAVENAEIMVIAPYFPEYRPFIEMNGCKFVAVPPDTSAFQIRLEELESRITPNTQALIVNSPNNPSGVVYTVETLQRLAEVLTRKSREIGHPIYIIADEPYRELVYDGVDVPYLPNIYPDTVICYSYSKILSLPGERIGYVCVPGSATDSKALFDAIAGASRTLGHVCAPSLQQKVIASCVDVRPNLAAYDDNRMTLYNALTSYGYRCIKPDGAFYLFVEAPGGSAKAFSDRAKEYNLLVVPGDDFGCPDFFRLSTCVSHQMVLKSLPVFKKLEAVPIFEAPATQ